MESKDYKKIEESVKHWYFPLLMGIIFILVGIWVFRTPISSYIALAFLFAITFVVTGIIEIASAIFDKDKLRGWTWKLIVGIINLVIGVLLVALPDITFAVLPIYVAFAVSLRAFSSIGWSLDLRKYGVSDWWVLLLTGFIGLILASILLLNPAFAGLTAVFYTALAFIMVGVFQIYLSFGLRKLRNRPA